VELYEDGERIELLPDISLLETGEGRAYLSCGNEVVFYTNEEKLKASEATEASDIIIIGSQGKREKGVEISGDVSGRLILSSADIAVKSENDVSGRLYSISFPYYIELFGLFE
jgi:hypothetical protein